jgi:hypothetical protein
MYLFQNVYTFFHYMFEYLTFRTKPQNNLIEDIENPPNYEFVILHNNMIR